MTTPLFPPDLFEKQILQRGITQPQVLAAMKSIDRSAFVPAELRDLAYDDRPLPIGRGQTISQPYIVAYMSQLAEIAPHERVLEIGTGCGYQTAVLSRLAKEVFTIEIRPELHAQAKETLHRLGLKNVHFRLGNGYDGWPEEAPFDVILVTAAPPFVPEALKLQLSLRGRLLIPVGEKEQSLLKIVRTDTGFKESPLLSVRFVPLVTQAE